MKQKLVVIAEGHVIKVLQQTIIAMEALMSPEAAAEMIVEQEPYVEPKAKAVKAVEETPQDRARMQYRAILMTNGRTSAEVMAEVEENIKHLGGPLEVTFYRELVDVRLADKFTTEPELRRKFARPAGTSQRIVRDLVAAKLVEKMEIVRG